MKGFALDKDGDVLITNGEIQLVYDRELTQQNVKTTLGTNLREWYFDWDLGIDFTVLLGKVANKELIKYEIEKGLKQVDETFEITDFSISRDNATRNMAITFTARNGSGEEVGGEQDYAY